RVVVVGGDSENACGHGSIAGQWRQRLTAEHAEHAEMRCATRPAKPAARRGGKSAANANDPIPAFVFAALFTPRGPQSGPSRTAVFCDPSLASSPLDSGRSTKRRIFRREPLCELCALRGYFPS